MRNDAARPTRAPDPERLRPKVSLTVDSELLKWVDSNVGTGRYFKSRSDAIDWCLAEVRKKRGERIRLD
jgi:Arc/MetJ-type ribon-helix-helix transcriptional regulator